MMEGHCFQIFVLLILFATVRGFNKTRCLGPYNDSYTCPGLSDPLERTQCCLLNNQPACCLPGGSSCSDSADKRNYCPRPNDENDRTQCCVWDSQPTCCLSGGSKCSDEYADIRNYCPGPDYGADDPDCCEEQDSYEYKPICCNKKHKDLVSGLILGFVLGVPGLVAFVFALLFVYYGIKIECFERTTQS